MPAAELRDVITAEDWEAVMGLRLGPGQDAHSNDLPDNRLAGR